MFSLLSVTLLFWLALWAWGFRCSKVFGEVLSSLIRDSLPVIISPYGTLKLGRSASILCLGMKNFTGAESLCVSKAQPGWVYHTQSYQVFQALWGCGLIIPLLRIPSLSFCGGISLLSAFPLTHHPWARTILLSSSRMPTIIFLVILGFHKGQRERLSFRNFDFLLWKHFEERQNKGLATFLD